MMVRAAALLVLSAGVLAGCDTPEPQRRPRGLIVGEATPRGPVNLPNPSVSPEPEPQPTLPTSSLPSPFLPRSPDPGALAGDGGTSGAAQAVAQDAADAGVRDLGRELRALLGQPATCLDLAATERVGGRLTLGVRAQVVPSGRITRVTVSAPGQPPQAVRCLEERVSTRNLAGPIPGAPLEVATSVPVEVFTQPAQPPADTRAPRTTTRAGAQPADGVQRAQPAENAQVAQPAERSELAQPAD